MEIKIPWDVICISTLADGGPRIVDAFVCPECSAIVYDQSQHEAWHEAETQGDKHE